MLELPSCIRGESFGRITTCHDSQAGAHPMPCRSFSKTTTHTFSAFRRCTKSLPSRTMSGIVKPPNKVRTDTISCAPTRIARQLRCDPSISVAGYKRHIVTLLTQRSADMPMLSEQSRLRPQWLACMLKASELAPFGSQTSDAIDKAGMAERLARRFSGGSDGLVLAKA